MMMWPWTSHDHLWMWRFVKDTLSARFACVCDTQKHSLVTCLPGWSGASAELLGVTQACLSQGRWRGFDSEGSLYWGEQRHRWRLLLGGSNGCPVCEWSAGTHAPPQAWRHSAAQINKLIFNMTHSPKNQTKIPPLVTCFSFLLETWLKSEVMCWSADMLPCRHMDRLFISPVRWSSQGCQHVIGGGGGDGTVCHCLLTWGQKPTESRCWAPELLASFIGGCGGTSPGQSCRMLH